MILAGLGAKVAGLLEPVAEQLPLWDRVGTWVLDTVKWPAENREWPLGIVKSVILLAIWWVAARILAGMAIGTIKRFTSKTKTDLDDKILAIAEPPLRRLIIVAGLYYALDALPLQEKLHRIATGVVYVAGVYYAVKLAHQLFLLVISVYGTKVRDPEGKTQFEKDYLPLISKVVGTVLAIIGLISVAHHFGQNVSALAAALGVGGVAVGFAAKDTLSNMLAGFMILVDRPFRPGDRIKLQSGEVGDVVEVGTRSTRLKLLDANMLIVPNSNLMMSPVVNFNFPNNVTRGMIEVGVAYGSDIEACKKIVLEAILADPDVIKDPPPAVLFTGFGDSALDIKGFYQISTFERMGAVQDRVRVDVYRRFNDAGVKIPFPMREIVVEQAQAAAVVPRVARE